MLLYECINEYMNLVHMFSCRVPKKKGACKGCTTRTRNMSNCGGRGTYAIGLVMKFLTFIVLSRQSKILVVRYTINVL